ncbi:MAG TPA: putative metal-binding motif-containing protein, partial [Candidatus Polarisedimenticolia bacterium]|nr:putative metal-binding motif-containing protein [Candidatus Polarisedimenticolia bacterium]
NYSPFYDIAKYARSGGPCGNAGEIPGVVRHEWGHGLDNNDGGGLDNPSEAYADITEFLEDHNSCFGGNYHPGQQCTGFGNPCLDCTGLRDLDWDKRQAHTPTTPIFVASNCPEGNAPCGGQVHCEGSILGEALWDLATRDLPAAGLDQATAWQLVQRIWFTSRLGSGGNAYTCTLPSSDSCSAGSWFNRLRVFDDDDGNLGNGTPHAAAIYQAFSRHAIACGVATDPSNQSTTSCPSIGAPALEANGGSGSISLSWTPVPGGTSYLVLRNEFGCSYSFMPVASVPGTSFTDTGVAGLTYYYRVQAVGSNSACDGPVSTCHGAQVACLDADSDGSGSPGSPSCSRGSRTDCDDSNAAIYPGAPQLCDGLSNDCSNPAWPAVPANEADSDGDGHRICANDCNDANMAVWAIPEEAGNLLLSSNLQELTWSPPANMGGTTILYDTIRSAVAWDFMTGATCIETDDGSDLTANDPETPATGQVFLYIVRGGNSCGEGSLGAMSSGEQRTARSCP